MYSDSQTHLPMLHLLHTEAQTHRYTHSDSQTHLPMLHLLHIETQTHRYTYSDSQTHLLMLHLLHIETQIMKARDRRHHLPWCSLHFSLMFLRIFVTARKRSLRQGNVLTPVCHSVHRGALPPRRGLPGGLHPAGVCIQGRVCIQRGSASRGVCIQGAVGQTPPPPPSNTTGYGHREVGTHPTGMHSCLEIVLVLCVSMVIKAIELTMGMDPSSALTWDVFQNDLFSQNNHPCITLKNETL